MSKKWKIALTLVVLTIVGERIYWTSRNRIVRNFAVVEPGQLYRSAQPSSEELKEMVKELGIKTVINLRGRHENSDWYLEEEATVNQLGIKLINVGMGTHHVPHKNELIKLLDAYKTAEKPILIHCRVGADRTGEAAALYQIEFAGKSKEVALQMLSPSYLHFDFVTPSKAFFVNQYKGMNWVHQEYDPCAQPFREYYEKQYCPDSKLNL